LEAVGFADVVVEVSGGSTRNVFDDGDARGERSTDIRSPLLIAGARVYIRQERGEHPNLEPPER
jgi:hypothetical protein